MRSWLTLTTFLPLVGVVALVAWPRIRDEAARAVALIVAVATFLVSLAMLGRFDSSVPGFQLVEQATWVGSLNLQYLVGVDGVSVWLVVLTTFLMPIAILASWKLDDRVRLFMATMLVLETGMIGTFLALDVLLFFLFFEAILFPMYLIIGVWGGQRRVYATVKFFLYTMFGSAFLLVAILFLYAKSGSLPGGPTFDVRELAGLTLAPATAKWLFLAFLVAFAVKVPLFPLHTWLPDAHTEAPTAGSVILAAVLLKIGAYGLIRFNLSLFPDASRSFADAISVLALIGIVYGAIVALMQSDLKRLVAYSSVSHLGFVVLGTFAFTQQAMAGGVLQMVNHGLSTGALFLLVGMVYERTHTRDLTQMGGLMAVTPWLAGTFLFVALSSLGLPGLNNFVGEFLVILGTLARNVWFGAVAAAGVVLAAIYLLWSYQRMAHGPVPEAQRHHHDLSLREVVVLVPVLAAILAIGVYPKLVLDRIEPTTDAIVTDVGAPPVGPAPPVPVAAEPGG
ncbi:MAG TPA: NADH-quinone oxidoreductase subunit M [Actinomycetota bacterium]|nr:NADH-quinone oxidoreductase subunit M [Actinomycetota bacterium]